MPAHQPADPTLLLTGEDAARRLSISRTCMFALIRVDPDTRTAQIPSVKIGKSRRISVAALNDYCRRLAEDAPPAAA